MRFKKNSLSVSSEWSLSLLFLGLLSLHKLSLVSHLSYYKACSTLTLSSLYLVVSYQLIPGLDLLESLPPSLNHLPRTNYHSSQFSDNHLCLLHWLYLLFSVKSIQSVSPRSLESIHKSIIKSLPGSSKIIGTIY